MGERAGVAKHEEMHMDTRVGELSRRRGGKNRRWMAKGDNMYDAHATEAEVQAKHEEEKRIKQEAEALARKSAEEQERLKMEAEEPSQKQQMATTKAAEKLKILEKEA